MRSFLRLQRSLNRPSNQIFFSATTKCYAHDSSPIPFPATTLSRRTWPIYVGGFACAIITLSVILEYKSKDESALNPINFTPFILIGKDSISSTSSIFTLRPIFASKNAGIYARAWEKGLWSLEVKQPQLQIARAYTPLPPTGADKSESSDDLRFLIREEPRGEVSGYLHRLPLGAGVDLRGPHTEYEFPKFPEHIEEVIFIAGGTGIAPALQLAHSIYNCNRSESSQAKIRILWANRRREDAFGEMRDSSGVPKEVSRSEEERAIDVATGARSPSTRHAAPAAAPQTALIQQLDTFKAISKKKLSVEYFIDEEDNFITEDVLRAHLNTPKTKLPSYPIEGPGTKLILISGPDGLVKHYAGPKAWKNGQEVQGPLGGVLKKLDTEGWIIHKL